MCMHGMQRLSAAAAGPRDRRKPVSGCDELLDRNPPQPADERGVGGRNRVAGEARPNHLQPPGRVAGRGQPVGNELAVLLFDEETRSLQLAQVLGDRGRSGAEDGGHLADTERPVRQHREKAKPCRMRERLGVGGEGGESLFRHFVILRNVDPRRSRRP